MASQSSFCLAALALSVLLLSLAPPSEANSEVYIYKIQSASTLNGYKITLQCSFGSGAAGERAIYRQINNTTERITNNTESVQSITFTLEARLEGYYYCQAGNVTSNKLLVLAFPSLDRRISSTRLPPVSIGETLLVPCAFQRDAFENRYQVTWFRGDVRVDPETPTFSRFAPQRNFSLLIRNVQSSDASELYQCELNATVGMQTIVRRAPFINVNVLVPITVFHEIEERIITPNEGAEMTCKIKGVPEPTITWMFNGQELSNRNHSVSIRSYVSQLSHGTTVINTLKLNASLGSGQVTCIGHHMEEGRLVMVSSQANFIVLSDRLQPKLILTRAGPRLQIMFPTHIPGEFDIMAYYNYQHHYSSRLISHPDFRNTQEVNIAIPSNKLPSFKTFSVRVALSVANKTGGASITSNQITLSDEFSPTITENDCYCPDVGGVSPKSFSNNVLIGVLAFFIVLLLIVIVALAVVGVLFFLCYRRMKKYSVKRTDDVVSDGGRFSEERDITKTPTFSCESPSRKASFASHGDDADSEMSDDMPEDLPHKALEQWDEKNKAAAVDDVTVDDETGIRMHSKEFVEYHHHPRPRGRGELPYVTNPALMHYNTPGKTKMKPSESTSSFEDLEDECAEMQTEAPRTM